MEKRIVVWVLAFAVGALALGILVPALLVEPTPPTDLPWQVEATAEGRTRVFGITLGETTLGDAERRLGPAELTMFSPPEGPKTIEGFFDQVTLSGLSAKMVVELRVAPDDMEALYGRGARISQLGSGVKKVTLAPLDEEAMRGVPIHAMTYMPAVNLSEELVAKRFGEPAERVKDPESEVVHWLYPALGLDVAISEKEKEVLQYVLPSEFERLRQPLRAAERISPKP